MNFASRLGLDLDAFAQVLSAGPMDSALARTKTDKLRVGDFEVQAAITDVIKNADLVAHAARDAGVSAPIIDICADLYHQTDDAGWGQLDMVAVVKAYQQRSDALGG
ncbi:3-hydroxyisobutyrate dehydrogenase-like beta-hydroxyacid dehydrogenase [Cryobacterium sp. MP_M5]|uniref:NAD-binding protein n=1 Tax=unclassified Cryobacterium TaxID=2649013 RepID=UPI0018C9D422|nr:MULTISPECIES: NAD-binding protein [unclassified Cryobacterium]MBG6059994.1 3-hydroxyisobutyrate dehydrogenase-like beta-hydroxyacid dehydrogenase [Cryobacterium sp. MP_M3]MEC5178412.1 3-hydroxyisobutyrate dehydrogenase-like beta-hydroxyacid dehydrogenase [Cryobacterium sp. MP_M5]